MRTKRLHDATLLGVMSVFFVTLFAPVNTARADDAGLKHLIAVDITAEAYRRDKKKIADEVQVRGAEVYLSGPIDPYFDGRLGLAAHPENGLSVFELHEATISSSKIIPFTNIKLGQAFLSLGKLNSTHQHDWPFISAPKVHATFFDKEGVGDLVIESTTNAPISFPLSLTLGVGKGWTYGHAHTAGERPLVPTHYLRTQTFTSLNADSGIQLGLNYLGRTDSKNERTQLVGLDLTTKWREGRTLRAFVQGEIWHRILTPDQGKSEKAVGAYLFSQANIYDGLELGIRYDSFQVLDLKDAAGSTIANQSEALVPTLTYKPSEFSTFRIGYAWEFETDSRSTRKVQNSKVELQSTFILGEHPAHDF